MTALMSSSINYEDRADDDRSHQIVVNIRRRPGWATDGKNSTQVEVIGPRLRVQELQASRWFPPIVNDLISLLELEPGWNSHGALPVDIAIVGEGIDALLRILHPDTVPPRVFPTPAGGVNFEWATNDFSVELSIDRKEGTVLSYGDGVNEWDGDISSAPAFVHSALKRLALP